MRWVEEGGGAVDGSVNAKSLGPERSTAPLGALAVGGGACARGAGGCEPCTETETTCPFTTLTASHHYRHSQRSQPLITTGTHDITSCHDGTTISHETPVRYGGPRYEMPCRRTTAQKACGESRSRCVPVRREVSWWISSTCPAVASCAPRTKNHLLRGARGGPRPSLGGGAALRGRGGGGLGPSRARGRRSGRRGRLQGSQA